MNFGIFNQYCKFIITKLCYEAIGTSLFQQMQNQQVSHTRVYIRQHVILNGHFVDSKDIRNFQTY